jgi:hypothetical protein
LIAADVDAPLKRVTMADVPDWIAVPQQIAPLEKLPRAHISRLDPAHRDISSTIATFKQI